MQFASILPVLLVVAAMTGCASNTARQAMELATAPAPATAPSGGTILPVSPTAPHASPQVSQQSGQGNLAAQLDASGWKGLEYVTAVPVGQVILMALMLLFSHRREVMRIRQRS